MWHVVFLMVCCSSSYNWFHISIYHLSAIGVASALLLGSPHADLPLRCNRDPPLFFLSELSARCYTVEIKHKMYFCWIMFMPYRIWLRVVCSLYLSTKLHVVTSQKTLTVIIAAMATSRVFFYVDVMSLLETWRHTSGCYHLVQEHRLCVGWSFQALLVGYDVGLG